MIIEWLWNQRGFAFPKVKTETKSSSAKITIVKKNAKTKKRKR